MEKRVIILITAFLTFLSGCTHFAPQKAYYQAIPLEKELKQILSDPAIQNANIGIYVENPRTRKIIYALNEHRLFMPASNMKLFTTCSGLKLLGENYRWKTYLLTDGKAENGILRGNLIVKGTGDPTNYGRFYNGDNLAVFKAWADTLKSLGINHITGNIVGDDNLFEDQALGFGWSWDDEPYYYSAQTSALCYNDNCVDISIVPGSKIGDTPQYILSPETDYISFTTSMRTVHPDSNASWEFWREGYSNRFNFWGTIRLNSDTVSTSLAVNNPTLFAVTVFKQILAEKGIAIDGNALDIDEPETSLPENKDTLFIHYSPPLKDVVHTINKVSHNLYAEQLQKTIGFEDTGFGSWKTGISAEKRFLAGLGIPPEDIEIVDGSGLSRHNLVSPFQTATVLRYALNAPFSETFIQSLPIAGKDGTLKRRFKGSNASGHVFAKTGYVNHVRSLSGYVETASGDTLIFSIMVNHYNIPTARINDLQDQIVTRLYNLF